MWGDVDNYDFSGIIGKNEGSGQMLGDSESIVEGKQNDKAYPTASKDGRSRHIGR